MANDHAHPTFARILDGFSGNAKQRAQQRAERRYRREPGECSYCDEHRNDSMMPSHTPSQFCLSGKRPHCTCDVCF